MNVTACSTVVQDDRTPEQCQTHTLAVVMRDSFLSGWGQAASGYSRAAWACAPEVNIDRVYNWVKSRSDARYVQIVDLRTYRPRSNTAHFHIYVCGPDHTAATY